MYIHVHILYVIYTQVGLFFISFPFPIVRIPDNSSNVPSSIVYFTFGADSLRIARAGNNPDSFSTAFKLLITHMSRHQVSIEKIKSFILKNFNKQGDFDNVFQSKQELLDLVRLIIIINTFSFDLFRLTSNSGCYHYTDKTIMPVFCT